MARLIERTFDPKKPLVARRDFVAAGRHYSVGDNFDWTRLSVAQRRVRQMFEANLVGHPEDSPRETPKASETVKQDPPPAKQETEVVTAPDHSDLDVDSLMALQAIARAEGAPFKTSKAAQREAIILHREDKE